MIEGVLRHDTEMNVEKAIRGTAIPVKRSKSGSSKIAGRNQ